MLNSIRSVSRARGRAGAGAGRSWAAGRHLSYPVAQAGHPPPTSVLSLSNGFRVACEESGSDITSTAIHVDAGTRHEKAHNNGVSNFIARLAGKGTKSRTQSALESELVGMGARLKIEVSREYTSFAIQGLSKDTGKHIEILSDVVKNAIYDEASLEKEKEKIMEDIEILQDDCETVTMDYLYSVAYQRTPLAHSLQGPTSNVSKMSRADIQEFIDNNYKAPRMLLSVVGGGAAGGVDKIADVAEKHLADVTYKYPGNAELVEPCRFTGMEVQHRDDELPLCHLALGLNAGYASRPERVALEIAMQTIGSQDRLTAGASYGLSRNNWTAFAADHSAGLYKVSSFSHFYSDAGMVGCYLVVDPKTLDDAGLYLGRWFMNLCHNPSETQVAKAKKALKMQILEESKNQRAVQKSIAEQVFYQGGDVIPLEQRLEEIDATSMKAVEQACIECFHDKDFARAAYGPTEAVTDYNRMRSALYWLRW